MIGYRAGRLWMLGLVWLGVGVGCTDTVDSNSKLNIEASTVEPENRVESDSGDKLHPSQIAFSRVQHLRGIKDAEFRLGGRDRIFLIEDQWNYDRYARLIPSLPATNFEANSLLVVTSWSNRPRFLHYVRLVDKTLIVGIAERPPPLYSTSYYSPPLFLVAQLPVWVGEVRIEINGQYHYTIWRGKELEAHTDRVWKDFLHVYSGNSPSKELQVRYWSQRWPRASRDEVREILYAGKKNYEIGKRALFTLLLNDLIDMRARPAIPRIFELIEAMGRNDKAYRPAWKALVGIGGPEVIQGCREALRSQNPESRVAAILILKDLGLPETRSIAYAHLTGPDIRLARGALGLLRRIGFKREDVPKFTQAILALESKMFDPNQSERLKNFTGSSSEDIGSLIYTLGSLGPLASEAIPTLEQLAEEPRYPRSTTLQKYAREALEKIRAGSVEKEHETNKAE